MRLKDPFTTLDIRTAERGFYAGHNVTVAVASKIVMTLLVIWALVWPGNASGTLASVNSRLLESFNSFYIIITGLFFFFLAALALIPATGKRVLGQPGDKPEFSNFSWFSMMFGAGLGVGLMVFATAEPLGLWGSNPVIVAGQVEPQTREAIQSAYRYTFAHYGFHAWGVYVLTGLALAYFAYTRNMPLTMRTTLTPIFGRAMNGILGDLVDILAVVATILGVAVSVGFGVSQFIEGMYSITGAGWIMDLTGATPHPSGVGIIAGLLVIMGLSVLSAASGVGRGIKILSDLNLVLSLVLLGVFVLFGSFFFAMTTYGTALVDYILHLPLLSFLAYSPESLATYTAALPEAARPLADQLYAGATNAWGSADSFREGLTGAAAQLPAETLTAAYAAGTEGREFGWQSGWTTFYWAWWIAFAPFVGLFLARISRGRTIREFIFGAVILPSLVCFAWMTVLGGTAIDLELKGTAGGAIVAAANTSKLFVTLQYMISGPLLTAISIMSVILVLTFLVTSADSGILVMNTIMSGGLQESGVRHRIIWGAILTLVIGTLLLAGQSGGANPMDAVKSAMIIGALPFTIIMGLMVVSLTMALIGDARRQRHIAAVPAE